MPRIRKKTTNRTTTRDRAKTHKKVVDGKRKKAKASKKNPTWKSKKKADPGIPNSFHLKDQVLAELAEEKRKTEEAKQARKEASRNGEDKEEDTPGVSSLSSTVLARPTAPLSGTAALPTPPASTDASDVPELVDTHLATLQDVLDRADVIVQVVDARDVLGGRSGAIEKLVQEAEGKVVLLVNKIDLVPREALQSWLVHLPTSTLLFSSRSTTSTSASPSILGKDQLLSAISSWAAEKSAKSTDDLVLALMGLPNTGKTSVLNALLPASSKKQSTAAVLPPTASAKHPAPTTAAPIEIGIKVGETTVRIIDTPGWEFVEDEPEMDDETQEDQVEDKWDVFETRLAGDLLRRNLGRIDRVKDALPLVKYIFQRSNPQDLMMAYNIPYFTPGDIDAFLTGVARVNARTRKHGEPDIDSAARIILRDWATSSFPYYATPPSTKDVPALDNASAEEVLRVCKGKKELKKENAKGLIRFRSGAIDEREVILDDDYTAMLNPSDDEDEEDDDVEENEEDEEDEEDEDVDEELVDGLSDGEELELEDGPEPSSGSDLEEEEEEADIDEDEESEPEPEPISLKKRKRLSIEPRAATKKAKRVSFGRPEALSKKAQIAAEPRDVVGILKKAVGGGKRKRA
ncbi:hypothetical protein BCR39DRAFT_523779 [Naematelia encephala]|uniref:P-loop containing nucleoside triphosphate hydrolase protein n=1 Tax=Naematelia encephala TaxID=71784 RepID=A0A1Y2BBT2_9TREE|nr:hypothetical protein BCR39DRAFT_523779 [Naematelia encephala]